MRHAPLPTILIGVALATSACDQPTSPLGEPASSVIDAKAGTTASSTKLDLALCALTRTDFTLTSGNDYFPLEIGSEWLLRGVDDGAEAELRITILDETETVGDVVTRVLEEREWEDGELVEVSRNFVAATEEGTICYFGEAVDIYENGEIVSSEGAWRADTEGNFPGILLPANPRPGMKFLMEGAPGIAEDRGMIVGSGPARTPAGVFRETVRVRESNPLDGDFDFKVYARDIGLVMDGPLSLVSFQIGGGG